MKLVLRLDRKLDHPLLRLAVEGRTRAALDRLTAHLSAVTLSVSPKTQREGGWSVCRISGTLARGGTIHVRGSEQSAQAAVDLALYRFRRSVFRQLDRRANVGARRSIRAAG